MQTYICKCGKTFEKSTTADTTGYVLQNFSPQHECYGCPYIVTERNWITQEIIKQECRATPKIKYRSFTDIGTDDKDFRTCHLYSLDLVFVRRVLNFVNSLEGAENHNHAIPDTWRAADFENRGLAKFLIYFQKNKKGTAARREVMQTFFNADGFRKSTSEEDEKYIVLQRIEIAKENAQGRCEPEKTEEKIMKFDVTSMLSSTHATAETLSVKEIPIDLLVPYGKHPFTLYTGERLDDMVQSVKNNGILTPIIVRDAAGKYEILAGHNRTNAAKIAGLTTVPAVVKTDLSDEDAEMYVIETNLMQRGFKDLHISEQAAVVALRHSKMFNENKVKAIHDELGAIEAGAEEPKNDSKLARVGEEYSLSKNTVARLIRVNKLLTADNEFTVALDSLRLSVRAAVELSYISSKEALAAIREAYKDSVVIDNIWRDSVKIDMKLAERLRELFEEFNGTQKAAELAIRGMNRNDKKPSKPRTYKLPSETYSKFFTENDSDEHINEVISAALEQYFADKKLDVAVSDMMEKYGEELEEKSEDTENIKS